MMVMMIIFTCRHVMTNLGEKLTDEEASFFFFLRRRVTFPLKDNSWKGKYRNGVIFTIFTIPGTYIYMRQEPRECLSHGQKLSAQIRGHFWFSSLGKQSNIQVIALISDLISCYFCFIQMKLSSLMRFACKIDHMVLILDRFLFAS